MTQLDMDNRYLDAVVEEIISMKKSRLPSTKHYTVSDSVFQKAKYRTMVRDVMEAIKNVERNRNE